MPIRQNSFLNRRRANRGVWNLRPTQESRRTNFQPFFFSGTTQNILNNSLYDRGPNNPLHTSDFLRETTHDTWDNIRLLLNLPENSRCAITQEQFTENEIVSRIYHCGHVFNHDALLRWFERDTRCPICRYNLTTNRNTSQTNQTNQTNQTSQTNQTNQTSQTESFETESKNEDTESETKSNNYSHPVTWREPLVSPISNTETASSILNTLADEIEANITSTLYDNSQNLISLSTQVANNLLGAMANNFENSTDLNQLWTTEMTFNFPPVIPNTSTTTGDNADDNADDNPD